MSARSEASLETGRRLSREAKRRRTGVCEDCGAVTRYSWRGTNGTSRFCPSCAAKRSNAARRGQGPRQQQLHALLSEPRRYSEIRDALTVTSEHTMVLLIRELRAGRIERVSRGVYRRAVE